MAAAVPTPATRSRLEEGLEHLRARRLPEAAAALRDALIAEPGRVAAVRGLATALLLAGDENAARGALREFVTAHPLSDEGWRLAARLEWKLGRWQAAIETLRRGIGRIPGSRILRGELELFTAAERGESGSESSARTVNDADWLDRLCQNPATLEAMLASPQSGGRDMLAALEVKLAAEVARHPKYADRQFLLARLRRGLGDAAGALAAVEAAIDLNPKLVAAQRLKATLLAELGRRQEAIGILRGLVMSGVTWPDLRRELESLESAPAMAERRAA